MKYENMNIVDIKRCAKILDIINELQDILNLDEYQKTPKEDRLFALNYVATDLHEKKWEYRVADNPCLFNSGDLNRALKALKDEAKEPWALTFRIKRIKDELYKISMRHNPDGVPNNV